MRLYQPKPADIAPLIDHTNLFPNATKADIGKLCEEAAEHGFASVCVNPVNVQYAASQLRGSDVAVCTVVGFPLGVTGSGVKAYEAAYALENGATEIDMVVNNGYVAEGDFLSVHHDMVAVAEAVKSDGGSVLKCIIEAGYLTFDQIRGVTRAVAQTAEEYNGIKFFTKTSTGMAISKLLVAKHQGSEGLETYAGAHPNDLKVIAATHTEFSDTPIGIKASGAVRTFEDAVKVLHAMGVSQKKDIHSDRYRIGASAGIKIISEE